MEFKRGLVVMVKAGHDAGRFCVVTKIENNFCFIADGKHRKLESPKKKNPLHLSPAKTIVDLDTIVSNRELRRYLSRLNGDHGEDFTHEGGK